MILTAVGGDFSVRRVERYLALAHDGGALPIVVLNKIDLIEDASALIAELEESAPVVPIARVSAHREEGLAELLPHLVPRETIALVGSSGVGKSTLVNRLSSEERQPTKPVRKADDKGRHTTVRRQLFRTSSGVLLIDTPRPSRSRAHRERRRRRDRLQRSARVAAGCRFRDCAHLSEAGCAVREAVDRGEISPERLAAYHQLRDETSIPDKKRRTKRIAKAYRAWVKLNRD